MIDIWQWIRDVIDGVTEAITDRLWAVFSYISDVVNGVVGAVAERLNDAVNAIQSHVSDIANGIVEGIRNALAPIADAFFSVLDSVSNWIHDMFSRISETLASWISQVADWVGNVASNIRDAIGNVIAGVGEWIGNIYNNIKDAISNVIDYVKDTIVNVYNTVKDWLGNVIATVGDWIRSGYEAVASFAESVRVTISDALRWMWERFLEMMQSINEIFASLSVIFTKTIPEKLQNWLDEYIIQPSVEAWNAYSAYANFISSNAHLSPAGQAAMSAGGGLIKIVSMIIWIIQLPQLISQIFNAVEAGGLEKTRTESIAREAPYSLPVSSAVEAFWRGKISEDEFRDAIAKAGMPSWCGDALVSIYERYPTPEILLTLWRRGLKTEEELNADLALQGFTAQRIEEIKKATELIPTPSDLISFVAREAFEPDSIQKYGLAEEFPEEFVDWMRKHGFDDESIKRYWYAHWQAPSLSQVYEMYHRGIIDYDEIWDFFKLVEITPYWRDKLIKLSFNPITRVDIRRIHQLGLLDHEGLVKRYRDIGYNPEDAELLAKFTEALNAKSTKEEKKAERDLTKSEILEAFLNELMSRDEAKAMLRGLGYDENESEMLVLLYEYKKGLKERNEEIELIKQGYEHREYTEEQVYDKLAKLKLTSNEVDYHYRKIVYGVKKETKLPSLTDLVKFVKKNLMDVNEFIDTLVASGYSPRHAAMYALTML